MFEDFLNALKNFKQNKTRTLLSLLGILIGVMSVIISTSLGSTLYVSVQQQVKDFSMDIIAVQPRWNRNTGMPYISFDEDYRRDLMAQIKEIKTIFFAREFSAFVNRENLSVGNKSISVVEPQRLEALRVELDYGKNFSINDFANGSQVAMIGEDIAKELFPEGNAVGKNITIQIGARENSPPYNFTFEVIGVLKAKNNWLFRSSDAVIVNYKFFKNQLSKVGDPFDVRMAEVLLHRQEDATRVMKLVQSISSEIASTRLGGTYQGEAVWAFSAGEEMKKFDQIMNMINLVLSAIAAVSLLVGGIGIMNIMLVTVTERKKEIGIRKALGATNVAIRNQFLIESATLTLVGGALGVALGTQLSRFVVVMFFPSEFIFSLNFNGMLISFFVSVSIGIFFGFYPAVKAAKLDPVVALQE